MEPEFSLASFEKSLNIKFHENPSTEGQDVFMWTETHIHMYIHTHTHTFHPSIKCVTETVGCGTSHKNTYTIFTT